MRFDYRIGTEATFLDWEEEGCTKAEAILEALEKAADSNDDKENEKTAAAE